MAIACPIDLNTSVLRSEISSIYARVAVEPDGEFHFHRGPAYAAEFLGYDAEELAALPPDCAASFAGIGNPLAIGPRIRQAWTAELLSQLWRDNQDTIALFKQAQGDLALANLTAQFADRKRELNPPPPVMQEIDQDIPFDEK